MVEFFESPTIFISLGNLHIYWYGVMYLVAFWTAWFLLPFLGKKRGVVLTRDEWTNIVAFGALGILLGGRIGYALFYEPSFFLGSPIEILKIWNGGMSSHGGFVGAAIGAWFATRYFPFLHKNDGERVSLFAIADVAAIPAAIGLALGRVGNSINQEFGIYPYYEAAGDVVIAIFCYFLVHKKKGTVFAIFLLFYSMLRFFLEYLRPQEWPLFLSLSRGQLLTIPLLVTAMILLKNAHKQ